MAKTPTPTSSPRTESTTTETPASDRLSVARQHLATRARLLSEALRQLQETQAAATSTALHARDLDALVTQSVLLRGAAEVIQAQHAAAEARTKLLAARDAVQQAQLAYDAQIHQVEQERRRAWALESDPALAAAVAKLEAAQGRSDDLLPEENRFDWRLRETRGAAIRRDVQARLYLAMRQAPAAATPTVAE